MTEETDSSNLPAQIANAISGIPAALVPSSLKALNRLIGEAIEVPAAMLRQYRAKIDAQTQAYTAVESAIARAAAAEAGEDPEIIRQAVNVLIRKEYRKQSNKQAITIAAIEDLGENEHPESKNSTSETKEEIDDDWLNIFERYAEDASTERMQKLWGRVLSGEIRKPGKYSMRTLRFLSEFSQADALTFADFCENSFGDMAPKTLVRPGSIKDIRHLIYMEAAGLIKGTEGLGLEKNFIVNPSGFIVIREENIAIVLAGNPGDEIKIPCLVLTPLGQELVSLLPGRDPRKVAETVANAIKSDKIKEAYLANIVSDQDPVIPMKVFWQENAPTIDAG